MADIMIGVTLFLCGFGLVVSVWMRENWIMDGGWDYSPHAFLLGLIAIIIGIVLAAPFEIIERLTL